MSGLIAPLDITKKGLLQANEVKESIDSFLTLILNSVCGESYIDPRFGFVFNTLRFEIFNEREGVIYNSLPDEEVLDNELYTKKISGSSKNLNTFAKDLRESIIRYEPRLEEVATSMSYVRRERKIYITVTGIISKTKEKYQFDTTFRIWN